MQRTLSYTEALASVRATYLGLHTMPFAGKHKRNVSRRVNHARYYPGRYRLYA